MQLTPYQEIWKPCTECGATATILNCNGSEYAGIWECINPECGASDACEHDPEHYQTEEIEHLSPDPDSSYYWTESVYVCGDCGVTIDADVADPAVDAHDAHVDEQIMEALGK